MSGDNVGGAGAGAGASKRKESSVDEVVTSGGPRKRTKTTATSAMSNRDQHAHNESGSESESGGIDVAPAVTVLALANLQKSYDQERYEYEREIDELHAELAASKKNEDKWRAKYNNNVDDLVKEKIAVAEKRVSEAEAKLKQMKVKAKQDIVNIRAELVAAAAEAVVAEPQNILFPDCVSKDASAALKKLKLHDPKGYSDLIKTQPDYLQLQAELKAEGPTVPHSQGVPILAAGDAMSSAKQALKALETDLLNASEDMRTNSTLANQKKTLCKKMNKALKEVEPIFLEHARRAQAKPEDMKPPPPSVDQPKFIRENQKLQFFVNELSRKLKDVRAKLEEEVRLRRQT